MQDSPNDANGVPITVGATVKLVGVVASINLLSTHYHDIEVTLSHPNTGINMPVQGIHGAQVTPPGAVYTIKVPANNLVVGF